MCSVERFFQEKLKSKLAKMPIEDLLLEMTNNNYYFPVNIWKKYFDKKSIESGKWISWFAIRQAEKIKDVKQAETLKAIIENKHTQKEIRKKAYFSLGHLSKNIKDKDIFEYLMNHLEFETEEIQETVLVAIIDADKPSDYNLNQIINILKNGSIGMKTSAAIALKNSKNPEIEVELLKSFQNERNKHLLEMIASTLRTVGTESSIPILEKALKFAKGRDYKFIIESALVEIKRRTNIKKQTRND